MPYQKITVTGENGEDTTELIEKDEITGKIKNNILNEHEFLNKYEPKIDIEVIKTWDDQSDKDKLRPAGIEVQLYQDGKAYGNTVKLTQDSGWTYKWVDLPKDADGKDFVYTADEISIPDGYTASVAYEDGKIVITNTHTPKESKIDIEVTKTWDDGEDKDKIRPTEITVALYDGTEKVEKLKLTKENDWKGKFTDLPADGDYSVEETAVSGYTAEYSCGAEDGFVIKNTHKPEEPPKEDKPPEEKPSDPPKTDEPPAPPTDEPPKPDEPKPPAPDNPEPPKPDAPSTGDEHNAALWIGVLSISILGVLITIFRRRKYNPQKTK